MNVALRVRNPLLWGGFLVLLVGVLVGVVLDDSVETDREASLRILERLRAPVHEDGDRFTWIGGLRTRGDLDEEVFRREVVEHAASRPEILYVLRFDSRGDLAWAEPEEAAPGVVASVREGGETGRIPEGASYLAPFRDSGDRALFGAVVGLVRAGRPAGSLVAVYSCREFLEAWVPEDVLDRYQVRLLAEDGGVLAEVSTEPRATVGASRIVRDLRPIPGLRIELARTLPTFLTEYVVPALLAVVLAAAAIALLRFGSREARGHRGTREQLEAREAFLRTVLEDQVELLCRFDPDGTLTFVNPAFARFYGTQPDQCTGRSIFAFVPEERREEIRAHLASFTPEDPVKTHESSVRSSAGECRCIHWTDRALYGDGENLLGYQSTGFDVTERVRAEGALEEARAELEARVEARTAELRELNAALETEISERQQTEDAAVATMERLDFLLTASPAVIYSAAPGGEFAPYYVSDTVRAQLGWAPDDFLRNPSFWAERIHPEDRERVLAAVGAGMDGEGDCNEYRFQAADGSYRWVRDEFRVARNPQGVPVELVGCWLDITGRKEAEDALRRSEESYRNLYETMDQGVLYIGEDGEIVAANPAAERITGRPFAELRLRPEWRAIREDGTPLPRDEFPANVARREGREVTGVTLGIHNPSRDEYRWVVASARPFFRTGEDRHQVYVIFQDVTEQRRALREVETLGARLRMVLGSAPLVLFVVDSEGVFRYSEGRGLQAAGLSSEEVVGRSAYELYGDLPIWDESRGESLSGREVLRRVTAGEELTGLTRHGERWFFNRFVPSGGSGSEGGLAGVAVDITERVRAEDELRWQRYLNQTLVETTPTFLATLDEEGRVLFLNPAARSALGYAEEEVEGRDFIEDLVVPRERAEMAAALREVLETSETREGENRLLTADGGELIVAWSARPMRSEDGAVRYVFGFGLDVTAQRGAEEEARRYQGQLRALASDLVRVEDRERRNLAVELHDSIAQELALAKVKLGALASRIPEDLSDEAREVRELVDHSIRSTRSLIFELSPPILHELGLRAAASWFLDRAGEREGVATDLAYAPDLPALDEENRAFLFRVLRELVTNAVKHARPSRVSAEFRKVGGSVEVVVRDDGKGFDPDRAPGGPDAGFGLFSIQERLRPLGGTLEVDSAPGSGTRISVVVPLEEERER